MSGKCPMCDIWEAYGFRCSAESHGECDCPVCTGLCMCCDDGPMEDEKGDYIPRDVDIAFAQNVIDMITHDGIWTTLSNRMAVYRVDKINKLLIAVSSTDEMNAMRREANDGIEYEETDEDEIKLFQNQTKMTFKAVGYTVIELTDVESN